MARKEVIAFLDYKRVKEKRRETLYQQLDILVEAVMDGDISFDENFNITHKLIFPLEVDGRVTVKELKYMSRINYGKLNSALSKVKSDDANGQLMATAKVLTGEGSNIIGAIDTADKSISESISAFFL